MKKKWFSGLAISMGIAAFPGLSEAQYAGTGSGLGASSFQLPPLPPGRSALAPTAYRQEAQASTGSGALIQAPAAYQDPYTLGQPQEHEAIPATPPIHSRPAPPPPPPVSGRQPIQDQPYPQPQPQIYAAPHSQAPNAQPAPHYLEPHQHAGPAHGASPSQAPCPACAAGSCAAHGVGPYYEDHSHENNPMYGIDSCSSGYDCEPTVTGLTTAVSPSPWIFGASGLIFNRIDDYDRKLASSGYAEWLSTGDAAMRASGGFQGSIGRYFGCGRYALVGTYWGIFSDEQMASITPGGGTNIRTDLPYTPIAPGVAPVPAWYGAYMPGSNRHVYDWYDSGSNGGTNNPATHSQRLMRDNEFHNVEVNLFTFALGGGARQGYPCAPGCGGGGFGHRNGGHGGYSHGGQCGDGCESCGGGTCGTAASCATGLTGPCAPWYGAQCSKLRLNTFGGFRWFRFSDELEYASSQTDNMYGMTDDDFYYVSDVTNDLVGLQLGTLATWCTGRRFNFFGGTSFGVYNNHIRTYTRAGTTMTEAMIRPLGSPTTTDVPFNFNNSLNDIAFIGEGTLGTGICVKPGWTLNLGYRVLGVAGVATSVGQIPTDYTHVSSVRGIRNDRSLILHGAVFGMNYNF
ncbi:MAG: hypothetical protein ACK5YR_11950 [Pirellula sp.]